MTDRFPWGDGPATGLNCAECGRRMGKTTGHYLTRTTSHTLLCGKCIFRHASTRPLHAKYYPDCPIDWHDLWDHGFIHATRAGAWYALAGRISEEVQP